MNRISTLIIVLLLAGAAAACGVGPESQPRALPPEAASGVAVPAPARSDPHAGLISELWFVADNRLVPVSRTTRRAQTAQEKLDALQAGPTASELAQGLRTTVTAVAADRPLVQTAEAAGLEVPTGDGQVAVVLGEDFGSLPSEEQLFILGQVVLTLVSDDRTSVVFVDDTGRPVGVPLPDGRLTSDAVTGSDYSALTG